MATFNPQAISTNIVATTKFSEYRNKIQQSMDQFGSNLNAELVTMFGTLSTETTYTQAQMDALLAAIDTRHNNGVW